MKRWILFFALLLFSAFALAAININTATKEELDALPGIGPVKAQAIVDYRTKNGPFRTIEDIMKVPGIKEGTFGPLKDKISVSGASTPVAAPRAPSGRDLDQHPVAVHRFFHVSRWNEHILVVLAAVVRPHEAVSVPMTQQQSGNHRLPGWKGILAPLDAMDDSLGIQFIKIALEAAPLIAVEIEKTHHLTERKCPPLMAAHKFQNILFLACGKQISPPSEYYQTERDLEGSGKLKSGAVPTRPARVLGQKSEASDF
jgi:competence protein ComEA